MFWLFLFTVFHWVHASEETILFCIPSQMETFTKNRLESTIKNCLQTNFIYGMDNIPSKNVFLDMYMDVLENKKITEQLEDLSQHQKEQLMLELRDIQYKSANNAHAIQKCADMSEKMPTGIVSVEEIKNVFFEYKIWRHHSKRDLDHCIHVLLSQVIHFQKQKIQRIQFALRFYEDGFQKIILSRNHLRLIHQNFTDIRHIFIQELIKYQTPL